MTGGHDDDNHDLHRKRQWLALQRLLYCMERPAVIHPPENKIKDDDGDDDDDDWSAAPPSWQSLLHRAQHCQELWQHILQLEEGSDLDPSLQLQISRRVDQACRKAFEQADIQRRKQQELQQQHSDAKVGDLIDRIFFSSTDDEKKDDEEAGLEDEDPYDGLLEDDENEKEEILRQSHAQHSETISAAVSNTNMSLEELQQAQREQMEDAIGIMAQQMKQATQGIQQQIQQQTQQTLAELETVAEQNVVDVTAVAQSVQQHNQRQRKRNWGTWTLVFTVVGIFLFCLVTIFTIPKRPNTCLMFCTGPGQTSLVGWFAQPIRVVSKWTTMSVQQLTKLLDNNKEDGNEHEDVMDQAQQEEYAKLYQEDEMIRKEKEKLDQLLNSLQHSKDETNPPAAPKVEVEHRELPKKIDWRTALDDKESEMQQHDADDDMEDDPFGGRKPVAKQGVATKKLEKDVDPFGSRKVVENEAQAQPTKKAVEDATADRKPIKKMKDAASDDKDPFASRKPIDKSAGVDDDPFGGRKPIEETVKSVGKDKNDDLFTGRKPVNTKKTDEESSSDAKTAEIFPNGMVKDSDGEDKVANSKVPAKMKEVNMGDLLASLNQAAQKTKQEEVEEMGSFRKKGPRGTPSGLDPPTTDGVVDVDGALTRDGEAKLRVSPRDVRTAADTGDVSKLKEFLKLQPGFVDRQDRNKWTATHLAARNGHTEAVRVLHEHGASLTLHNNRDKTPLEEAIAHLGTEHETARLLRRLSGEDDSVGGGETTTFSTDSQYQDKLTKLQAKQEALRWALATNDDVHDLASYVQEGRSKLEKLDEAVKAPVVMRDIVFNDGDESLDQNQYVDAGRSRLDQVLNSRMKQEL